MPIHLIIVKKMSVWTKVLDLSTDWMNDIQEKNIHLVMISRSSHCKTLCGNTQYI